MFRKNNVLLFGSFHNPTVITVSDLSLSTQNETLKLTGQSKPGPTGSDTYKTLQLFHVLLTQRTTLMYLLLLKKSTYFIKIQI